MKKQIIAMLLFLSPLKAAEAPRLETIQQELKASQRNYQNVDDAIAYWDNILGLLRGYRPMQIGKPGELRGYLERVLGLSSQQVGRLIDQLDQDVKQLKRLKQLQQEEEQLASDVMVPRNRWIETPQLRDFYLRLTGEHQAPQPEEVERARALLVEAFQAAEREEQQQAQAAVPARGAAGRAEQSHAAEIARVPQPQLVNREYKRGVIGATGTIIALAGAGLLYKKMPQWMKNRVAGILKEHNYTLSDLTDGQQNMFIAASYARFLPDPAASAVFKRAVTALDQEVPQRLWPALYHVYYGNKQLKRAQKRTLKQQYKRARAGAA